MGRRSTLSTLNKGQPDRPRLRVLLGAPSARMKDVAEEMKVLNPSVHCPRTVGRRKETIESHEMRTLVLSSLLHLDVWSGERWQFEFKAYL